MLLQTFSRKQLRLKAHTVASHLLEERHRDDRANRARLGSRRLRCSRCGQELPAGAQPRGEATFLARPAVAPLRPRLVLRYRPRRVKCERCGVRTEPLPWAEPWARVSGALAAYLIPALTRHLSWREAAHHFGLNWKSVAAIVQRAVALWAGATAAQAAALDWRRRGQPPQSSTDTTRWSTSRSGVKLLWVGEYSHRRFRPRFGKIVVFCDLGRRRCPPHPGGG